MNNQDDEGNSTNMPDGDLLPSSIGTEVGDVTQADPSDQAVGNTDQNSVFADDQHILILLLNYLLLSFQLYLLPPELKDLVLFVINENQTLKDENIRLRGKRDELQQENNGLRKVEQDLQQENTVLKQSNLKFERKLQVQIDNKRILLRKRTSSETIYNSTNNGSNAVYTHYNDVRVNSDENQPHHEMYPSPVPPFRTNQELNNRDNVDAIQNGTVSGPTNLMETPIHQILSSAGLEYPTSYITPCIPSPDLNNRGDVDATPPNGTVSNPTNLETEEVQIPSSSDGHVICHSYHQRPTTIISNVGRESSQHIWNSVIEYLLVPVKKYGGSEIIKGLETRLKEKGQHWKLLKQSKCEVLNAVLKVSDDIIVCNRKEKNSEIEDAARINGRSKRMKRSEENIDARRTEEAEERKEKEKRKKRERKEKEKRKKRERKPWNRNIPH